jgi:hypothetical protein
MNTIRCEGLDGSNPLHFLAALGAYRLIAVADASARLSWSTSFPHVPIIESAFDESACHAHMVRTLGIRGILSLRRRRKRLAAEQAAVVATMETSAASKEGRVAVKQLKSRLAQYKRRIARIDAAFEGNGENTVRQWHPCLALADCIHKIPRKEFRRVAQMAMSDIWSVLLPGLACDCEQAYKKDESGLSRTRFSFSNGGAGKALLKDVIRCFLQIVPGSTAAGFLGFDTSTVEVTGLMWEPTEQRSYALRWLNPDGDGVRSVPIYNVCAFFGLSYFPVLPGMSADRTVGFNFEESVLVWPIWSVPLTADVICSLLATSIGSSCLPADANTTGILVRYQCAVQCANKRNFFSPSRPV